MRSENILKIISIKSCGGKEPGTWGKGRSGIKLPIIFSFYSATFLEWRPDTQGGSAPMHWAWLEHGFECLSSGLWGEGRSHECGLQQCIGLVRWSFAGASACVCGFRASRSLFVDGTLLRLISRACLDRHRRRELFFKKFIAIDIETLLGRIRGKEPFGWIARNLIPYCSVVDRKISRVIK